MLRVTEMLLKKKATHKLMLIAFACVVCLGPLSAHVDVAADRDVVLGRVLVVVGALPG